MPTELASIEGLPRHEWLALRRRGLGSSDAPAICGLDRFNSPTSVYQDKIGEADEEEESDRMRLGRKLEDVVASEFELHTGIETTKPTVMYQHPVRTFQLASPDRLTAAGEPCELKTYTGFGDVWADGPPQSVVLQLTHQALVVEQHGGWVAVLEHGHRFRHWRVNVDPDVAELLVGIEEEFWARVVSRTPPPADGHPATTAALAKLYRHIEPGAVIDASALAGTVDRLRTVKRDLKTLEAEEAALANELKAALGPAETGELGDGRRYSWKPSAAFDEDRFRAEQPDLAASFSRVALGPLEEAHPDVVSQYRVAGAGARRLNLPRKDATP